MSSEEVDDGQEQEVVEGHVLERFELQERVGEGAYGVVWRAVEKATGRTVAIKKMFDAFRDQQDAQRTYREVALLRAFRSHPDVVQLHEVILGQGDSKDLYLILEFVESDLFSVVEASELISEFAPEQTLATPIAMKWVIYQLVRSLAYLHSAGVMHRDVKTGNVLINRAAKIKICDLGLSRCCRRVSVFPETEYPTGELTGYIANLRYRAPEVILGCTSYTPAVDMWALGCVLAHILTGDPLFDGEDPLDQLQQITRLTGAPLESDIESFNSSTSYSMLEAANIDMIPDKSLPRASMAATFRSYAIEDDEFDTENDLGVELPGSRLSAAWAAERFGGLGRSSVDVFESPRLHKRSSSDPKLKGLGPNTSNSSPAPHHSHTLVTERLNEMFIYEDDVDPLLVDLIAHLLDFHPARRYTAVQALSHPYLADVRRVESEVLCSAPVRPALDDTQLFTVDEYRRGVEQEAQELAQMVGQALEDDLLRPEWFNLRVCELDLVIPESRTSANSFAPRNHPRPAA